MGQSYRIRTTPGQDKNIQVQIDQDFEQLEILSLKIRQQDVYTRMCSDYGVIAGRVIANNGYGIPNAKISIFIPLLPEDEENPVITAIYPYKNLEQKNEDGYVYNLLPYVPSYSEHVPTGTFPSRTDALTNQTVVKLYNNYYKFTVSTNDSGDFLIFGVPTGTQTLVMNVDLSDIGPFSMTPQDLIRMGLANEEQFDGVRFKASSNLNELPQIIRISKTVEILPFWGQPEICQIGINRVDFDLTGEANIDIKPTSIFMGSLMSSSEKTGVKQNGRASKATGDLCRMITGPGEIIAITQSIFQDSDGLPILERANLPNGGKLIDGDGTWLFDLPMNLDYVYTNEFGENVLSEDPNVGVPTKGKYRFKIKWQQSRNINEDYKRAYYLVPNVKEKGWDINNPNNDPLTLQLGPNAFLEAQSSYAFSLDWSAYTINQVSINNPDILSIINCEDYFYEFDYNKVYTVSQFIDQDKRRKRRDRFIGIKRIGDETCTDTTNKYPVNDAVFHTTLQWIINNFLITIVGVIMGPIIIAYSIIAWVINWIYAMIWNVFCFMCTQVGFSIVAISWYPFGFICRWLGIDCSQYENPCPPIKFPMLTYPDCEACDCENPDSEDGAEPIPPVNIPNPGSQPNESFFTPFYSSSNGGGFAPSANLQGQPVGGVTPDTVDDLYRGFFPTDDQSVLSILSGENYRPSNMTSNDLPLSERINSFNVKGKYYDYNGGVNQVSVKYEPSNINNTQNHLDNVLVFITHSKNLKTYTAATIFTLVDILTSNDPNVTGSTLNPYGTNNLTGTTNYPSVINVEYANPTTSVGNLSATYNLPTNFTDLRVYSYVSDVEYYQVITGFTINDFINSINPNPTDGSFADILNGKSYIFKTILGNTILGSPNMYELINPNKAVLIVQRGVDPYSPRYNTKFGLGKIFGFDNHSSVEITFDYRLNIPVKNIDTNIGGSPGSRLLFDHGAATTNGSINNGQYLFFPSYIFTASTNFISYTTNFHRYYSNLDASILTTPPTIFTSDPLSGYVNVGTNNNAQTLTPKFQNGFYFGQPNTNTDGKIYYLNTSQQGTLSRNQGSTSTSTTAMTVSAGSTKKFIYTMPTGYPNRNLLPKGDWTLNFLASSSNGNTTFEFKIYKKSVSNITTQINSSSPVSGSIGSTPPTIVQIVNNIPNDVTLQLTDRLVIEIIAKNNDSSNSTTVTLYTEGDNGGYILTTFNRDDAKYIKNEILDGGSYRYLDSAGNQKVFSPIYGSISMNMSDNTRIVMRSDRLPSTDRLDTNGDNTFTLQNNTDSVSYLLGEGLVQTFGTTQAGAPSYNSNFDPANTGDTTGLDSNLLNNFTCTAMRDLSCYQGTGLSLTVDPNCLTDRVVNGCYVFVRRPLFGLFGENGDVKQLIEYIGRLKFYYALCNEVIGETFINNWINGNLYAFPFKVNTYYNKLNQVRKRVYPRRVVVLQYESNNFYYRSSPYTTSGQFIGSPASSSTSYGSNDRNLKYPTTIMNLGPRSSFLKEITLNGNFAGYNVDKLTPTSYNNMEDLTNFFSVTRLTNLNFLKFLFKKSVVKNLFSRPGQKIDGDFAQTAAINSQLGIIPLDGDYYTSANPNPDVIAANAGSTNEAIMGVYFNSTEDDLQIRDYISPGRTIRYNPNTGLFRYDYLPIKSQVVPNYKWTIQPGGVTMFGTQLNNWATSINNIEALKYQSMDRISSNYPSGVIHNDYDYRGYLFGVQIPPTILNPGSVLSVGTTYVIDTYFPGDDFTNVGAPAPNETGQVFVATGPTPAVWNGSVIVDRGQYQTQPYLTPNPALGGAPWYFYFGLTRGATALDRFSKIYIGETGLNG